jgi:exodeoxyribonuclease VII large subunit
VQLRLPRTQLTVDELTFHIQGLFMSDAALRSVVVSGEISEFKRHTSGHCYFTLLGEESRVACAVFKQRAGFIPRWPDNGDNVLVEGSVGLYAQRGAYQLYARRLTPVGAGAVERARRELRDRFEKEGLFDAALKRPLPPYPAKVALITSTTGAAVQDVLRVARRRCPACDIVVIGAQVQGVNAPEELVQAFSRISAIPKLDCVILARGGGSREDLVPFDDERVARALRTCPFPVVCGVGHDVDMTLCDLVADVRASTPSAAAELVFPNSAELVQALREVQERMVVGARMRIDAYRRRLDHLESTLDSRIRRVFLTAGTTLEALQTKLSAAAALRLMEAREALAVRAASLDALSPLAVLTRGFAVCERGGERIRSVNSLSPRTRVTIRFSDGAAETKVEKIISGGI